MLRGLLALFMYSIAASTFLSAEAQSSSSITYVGCFADSSTRRDLDKFLWSSDKNNPELCATACRHRGYIVAGVQNASDCYCGVSSAILYRKEDPLSCNLSCPGDAEKKCGGAFQNSVYRIENDQVEELKVKEITGRFFVQAVDGIHISHIDSECGMLNCYATCEEIADVRQVENRDKLTIIRTTFCKLSDIQKHVAEGVEQVQLHTQTLVVDTSESFTFSLIISTRKIVLVSSSAEIQLTVDGEVSTYNWSEVKSRRLHVDTQFMKLSYMCASELLKHENLDMINIGWAILNYIRRAPGSNTEHVRLKKSFTAQIVSVSTLTDNNINYLAPFSHSFIDATLRSYNVSLVKAEERFRKYKYEDDDSIRRELLTKVINDYKVPLLNVTRSIIGTKFIALHESQGYIREFADQYWTLRKTFSVASQKFKKGASTAWEANPAVGEFVGRLSARIEGNKNISLKQVMQQVERVMRSPIGTSAGRIHRLTERFNVMESFIQFLSYFGGDPIKFQQFDIGSLISYFLTMSNFQINEEFASFKIAIGNIMKNGRIILKYYTNDYYLAFIEFSNSAMVLMNSLFQHSVELLSYMRDVYWNEYNEDLMERVSKLFRKDNLPDTSDTGELLASITDIQYSIRMHIFNFITEFCNIYLFEQKKSCPGKFETTFQASLPTHIYRIQNILVGKDDYSSDAFSSSRTVTIVKKPLYPTDCLDVMVCPMKFFGETRKLYYSLEFNNPEVDDLDSFSIYEIEVELVGAIGNSPESIIDISISSNGLFRNRAHKSNVAFIAKPFRANYSYNTFTGVVVTRSMIYSNDRNITTRVSPFTNWMITITGNDIFVYFKSVTEIRLKFRGDIKLIGYSMDEEEGSEDCEYCFIDGFRAYVDQLQNDNQESVARAADNAMHIQKRTLELDYNNLSYFSASNFNEIDGKETCVNTGEKSFRRTGRSDLDRVKADRRKMQALAKNKLSETVSKTAAVFKAC